MIKRIIRKSMQDLPVARDRNGSFCSNCSNSAAELRLDWKWLRSGNLDIRGEGVAQVVQ
jgi:hypothetical protein